MSYGYGLRVIDLKEGRPMLEFGIGVSESFLPTQQDILRWGNDRYQVICWFSMTDINKCIDSGMIFVDYFGEGYENL